MDFDDQDEEEEMEMEAQPTGYDSLPNSGRSTKTRVIDVGGSGGGGGFGGVSALTPRKSGVRYRECLKNHAVNIGGHALDGCGDFLSAGEEGSIDALKCAACNCHRNFHRKETEGEATTYSHIQHHHHLTSPYYRAPPPAGYLHLTQTPRPLALPAVSGEGGYSREEEDVSNPSSSGGGGSGGGMKKRFRTKFSQEQKEKMLGFAERLGWRIQKHDDVALEQFCAETGVKRHVLKVWMHNNKHTLGKKL